MAVVVWIGLAAWCSAAHAVTDEEVFSGWRFTSALPGARAAGMARAGLALVDDPAALRINPARLASLSDPQVSLELRWRDADPQNGSSDLVGVDPDANPFAGTRASRQVEVDQGARPSFVAYAHPWRALNRPLVLGFARTEASSLSVQAWTSTTSVPVSAPIGPDSGVQVTRVSRGSLDARLALYDAGAGWRLTPTFAAGASLVAGTLDLETRTTGLLADPLQLTGPGMVDPRFGTVVPAPLMETRTSSSDTALAFSFGSYWTPARSLGVAAVFRKGPRFDASSDMVDRVTGHRISEETTVRLPDTAALGFAWKPFLGRPSTTLQSLTFALDVERASDASVEGIVTPRRTIHTMADTVRRVSAVVDGETQARLGMEVRRSYPGWTLALRGGAYNDRAPVVRREVLAGDMPMAEGEAAALGEAGFLERPDARLHVTAGAGMAFYLLSLDLGLDVSSDDAQIAASATWKFGR